MPPHGHGKHIGQDHAYREDHDSNEQDQKRHERRAPLRRYASRWMVHDPHPLLSPTATPPCFRNHEKCPGWPLASRVGSVPDVDLIGSNML